MSHPFPLFLALEISPQLGGPYKSVRLFREALNGRVISLSKTFSSGDKCESGIIEYMSSTSDLFIGNRTRHALLEEAKNCDLISCHSIFRSHNNVARDLARRLSIPYWAIPHGSMDPWVFTQDRFKKELWYKVFGERYFKDAAHIILATERERDKMGERYDGSNLRVIHWPVEPLDLAKKQEARINLRRSLNIPEASRLLLYFGRYHSMKQPVETIEIFRRANVSEHTHLLMVGYDGDVTQKQLAAVADEHPRIHVCGPMRGDEREMVLLGADAYISLSHRENFNHTAAEAMTGAQALILSPGNDLRYSFPSESTFGWMLQGNSEDEVVEVIRAFEKINDQELCRMGENAMVWACNTLSFEVFRNKLLALHVEATGNPLRV
jgi:glycosyltransferase involved in cell wall biosynthesis